MNNDTYHLHNMNMNHVKFTGSAFEFPDEARTIVLYLATLLFMIIWINDDARRE
jgi:hypothetical protein